MKEELNIAAILKDKPVGLKFYSPTFGRITFNGVHKGKVYFFSEDTNAHSVKQNGKMYDGGDCIIFPSKQMRDWSKFAWKKGDVLVNSRGLKILFDRWANDNYTSFYAKTINLVEDGFLDTNLHTLASEKEAKSFIKCIEEKLGGKLNRETLKIEKAQPEFKDGDIVFSPMTDNEYESIFIFKEFKDDKAIYYAGLVFERCNLPQLYINDDFSEFMGERGVNKVYRPATDSEKQQLFDALAKEGKAWDSDEKVLVDLPKKCEFKAFDRCVWRIQNVEGYIWQASFISYVDEYDAVPMGVHVDDDLANLIVLPYNDQTKHLLGTTDEWEGGE